MSVDMDELKHGDSVWARWEDKWFVGRVRVEEGVERGRHMVVQDDGDAKLIRVEDVKRFEETFVCSHAHHEDFRDAPKGYFADYAVRVLDHGDLPSVRCETCHSVPCAALCGRWFADEGERAAPPPPRPKKRARADGGAVRRSSLGGDACKARTARDARPSIGDAIDRATKGCFNVT